MKHRKARVRRKHWCKSCDLALVSDGAKCPNCGKKALSKSLSVKDLRKIQNVEISNWEAT